MSAFHNFIHACQGRQVTPFSAAQGLCAGAALGGVITGLPGLIGGPYVLATVLVATVVWAFGLVLAIPAWWLMHRLKLRCWSAAMGLGAILAPVGTRIFGDWHLWLVMAFSVVGALVGLTVWLVAYRKPAEGAVCA